MGSKLKIFSKKFDKVIGIFMGICYTLFVKIGTFAMIRLIMYLYYFLRIPPLLFEKYASPARMGVYLWKNLLWTAEPRCAERLKSVA
jgi:hypothetical protein